MNEFIIKLIFASTIMLGMLLLIYAILKMIFKNERTELKKSIEDMMENNIALQNEVSDLKTSNQILKLKCAEITKEKKHMEERLKSFTQRTKPVNRRFKYTMSEDTNK